MLNEYETRVALTAAAITGIAANPVLMQMALQKYGSVILNHDNVHVEKEIAQMAVKIAEQAEALLVKPTTQP